MLNQKKFLLHIIVDSIKAFNLKLFFQNIKTYFFRISFIILASIAGINCSSNSNKVQIDFWAFGAEAEHVQKLTNEFEKLNPGIIVKVQAIPWTAAHEKLITAYASETTPDIVQLGNTWIPEFVALNSLEDLDKWVDSSKSINEKRFFPGIWQTNIINT